MYIVCRSANDSLAGNAKKVVLDLEKWCRKVTICRLTTSSNLIYRGNLSVNTNPRKKLSLLHINADSDGGGGGSGALLNFTKRTDLCVIPILLFILVWRLSSLYSTLQYYPFSFSRQVRLDFSRRKSSWVGSRHELRVSSPKTVESSASVSFRLCCGVGFQRPFCCALFFNFT